MDEQALLEKLKELIEVFDEPRPPSKKKESKIAEAPKDCKGLQIDGLSLEFLKESLDYLGICIKYLFFDLEATRRENEYLRKCLKEIS